MVVVLICGCGRIGFDSPAAASSAMFGSPVRVNELDTTSDDNMPSMRADQLEIIFGSTRGGPTAFWSATRIATDQPFSNIAPVTIPGTSTLIEPALSDDGLTLLLEIVGTFAVSVATRPTTADPWGTPVTVDELAGYSGPDFIGDLRLIMRDANGYLTEATRPDTATPWTVGRRLDEALHRWRCQRVSNRERRRARGVLRAGRRSE